MMHEATEEQVRALRDYVFGMPSTDKNWSWCKDGWMRPDSLKWLGEQAGIVAEKAAIVFGGHHA